MYRAKYNKEGNCIVDYLLADYCPVLPLPAPPPSLSSVVRNVLDWFRRRLTTHERQGCALAQMEADLETKGGSDSGVADMER